MTDESPRPLVRRYTSPITKFPVPVGEPFPGTITGSDILRIARANGGRITAVEIWNLTQDYAAYKRALEKVSALIRSGYAYWDKPGKLTIARTLIVHTIYMRDIEDNC